MRREAGDVLFVVPDTNCVYGQLAKGGSALWKNLIGLSGHADVVFAVAEVTLRELGEQAEREMRSTSAQFERSAEQLRASGFQIPPYPDLEAQRGQLVAARTEEARSDVLKRGGHILPLAGTLEGLLERSLRVRPPFSEKDRGFRDALLWEAVVELVTQGHEVILISNDQRAFGGEEPDGLHPELEQELRAAGGHEDSLVLARSPGAAIERVTAGYSEAHDAEVALQREGYFFGEATRELAAAAAGWEIQQSELLRQGHEDSMLGVRVEAVHSPVSFSPGTAVPRASGRITVEVRCDFGADLEARAEDIYADFEPFVGDGDLDDIGVGLLDNHLHLQVKNRTVRVGGELSLTLLHGGLTLDAVCLTDVGLPPAAEMPVTA